MRISVLLCIPALVFCLPTTAGAQAAVEYGLGAGRSATMAGPAKRVGKSAGGAFDNLNKTLRTVPGVAGPARGSGPAKPRVSELSTKRPGVQKATEAAEDPALIQTGMQEEELTRRFGRPGLEIAAGDGTKRLVYPKKPGSVEVELREGKVTRVDYGSAAEDASVTLP